MAYIYGFDRTQVDMVAPDQWVPKDSYVRVIDAFVENILMKDSAFQIKEEKIMGRPGFSPATMLKIYIYGTMNKCRSSRILARECRRNIEMRWLVNGLEPDFRTISDFRKNNADVIPRALLLFNEFCSTSLLDDKGAPLLGGGYYSIDGSKFRANQTKDKCFSAVKIDDRIRNDEERIAYYERIMEDMDDQDKKEDNANEASPVPSIPKEVLEKKVAEYKKRKSEHEEIRKRIEETDTQVSLTDPDSRLMKNHYGGCAPAYNIQTAVDSKTHLIAGFLATNACTDHGLISSTVDTIKDGREIKEIVADNGYRSEKDIVECLEKGVIPHVVPDKKKTENGDKVLGRDLTVSFDYDPEEITDVMKKSTNPADIKKCLRSGIVPDCYATYLSQTGADGSANVSDKRYYEETPAEENKSLSGYTEQQMMELAMQGYFVRDVEKGKVYCPAGRILRRKSVKSNGTICFCNKLACKECMSKCFSGSDCITKWKEVSFAPNQVVKPLRKENKVPSELIAPKRSSLKKKVVTYRFWPDLKKLENRKCLSEHPFGTVKRTMGGDFFLLRGLEKIGAEFSFLALGYNIRRVLGILSPRRILTAMGV